MPLPPALLARLKERGIVKQPQQPAPTSAIEGEEVYAESYDVEEGEFEGEGVEGSGEKGGRYRGGAPGCPNKYNHYHVCSDYCFDHWREGWSEARLPTDYLDERRRMLKLHPLPIGWKEVYDAGVRRHYYWCPATDEVCWLSPRHPKAVISEPAPKLAKEYWVDYHEATRAAEASAKAKRLAASRRGRGRGRGRGGDAGAYDDEEEEDYGGKQATAGHSSDDEQGREKSELSDRDRLKRARRRGIDPMDPAAYGDAPVGTWSSGIASEVKTGVDVTANGPLFQQRPYPAPGAILRKQQPGGSGK